MLINLVKKDLILVKKYLLFLVAFTAAAPVYLASKMRVEDSGSILFFVIALMLEYVLFSQISKIESDSKGAALICATPYTRSAFVKAKYLFLLVAFIGIIIIQIITSFFFQAIMGRLTIYTIGVTFLVLSISFGILIPVQFKFGYDKTRFIFFFIIFFVPFVSPSMIRWFQSRHFAFTVPFSLSPNMQGALFSLIALIIGFVSMAITLKIYAKKDL